MQTGQQDTLDTGERRCRAAPGDLWVQTLLRKTTTENKTHPRAGEAELPGDHLPERRRHGVAAVPQGCSTPTRPRAVGNSGKVSGTVIPPAL